LWSETLEEALRLSPTHLSTYGLTFEKGTTFYSRLTKGSLQRCEEESEREMYALAMDRLPRAGFEQYELSNFARPGFRSRHNEIYWRGLPFFGFGPGAARYLAGRRELNHRSVTTWIKRIEAGQSPIADSEELSPEDRARERIMLGLRRAGGIELSQFKQETGFDFRELSPASLSQNLDRRLLEEVDGSIRLTREGRFVADTVIVDFL
jgi:oxygen-independent coproporphyrinogen III oxidase